MIKYVYIILSFFMAVNLIDGIPMVDIFSEGWHLISLWSLVVFAFLSPFGIVIILLCYAEEHDNPQSDVAQFFLRTTIGLKFLPKWPPVLWLVLAAVLVQLDKISIALAVTLLAGFAASIVYVHNGFYRKFLMQEAKGSE